MQPPSFHRIDAPGMGGAGDDLLIEILDDGAIKITTDPISGANHMSAEGLLRRIAELAGGETTRAHRTRVTNTRQKQTLDQHLKS